MRKGPGSGDGSGGDPGSGNRGGTGNRPPSKSDVTPADAVFQIPLFLGNVVEAKITERVSSQLAVPIKDPTTGATVSLFPNPPAVRTVWINQNENIGIWRQSPGSTDLMDQALANVGRLNGGGPLAALFVSIDFLRFIARLIFEKLPKRWNDSGPDDKGDIILNDIFISLGGKSDVVTHLKGTLVRPLFPISFEHTITDTLGIDSDGRLKVTSTEDTNYDTGAAVEDFLIGAVGGFPGYVLTEISRFAAHALIQALAGGSPGRSGIGAMIPLVAPARIFNGNQVIEFKYETVSVNDKGVLALAGWFPRKANPRVVITPETVGGFYLRRPPTITAQFKFTTQDLDTPSTITWSSSDGRILRQSDQDQSATIEFTIKKSEDLNAISRHVQVKVTDASGTSVTAVQEVEVDIELGKPVAHKAAH